MNIMQRCNSCLLGSARAMLYRIQLYLTAALVLVCCPIAFAQFGINIHLDPKDLISKKNHAQPEPMKMPATTAEAEAALAACKERDKVLWQYICGLMHMRQGDFSKAKGHFENALQTVDGRFGKDRTAKRSRSYFSGEAKKTFVGEPYERVMANYYLGILYWMDEGPNRARPCFKNALYEDSYVGDERYACDYVLCEYLDAIAAVKLGQNGDDAALRARAITNTVTIPPFTGPSLPPPNAKANVLIFVEFGNGPVKYAAGEHNEELHVHPVQGRAQSVRLQIGTQTLVLSAYDDLYFQASTRGGRAMDHINKGKAVFKDSTAVVGAAALYAAALSTAAHVDDRVALGVAAFGFASSLLSAAGKPDADTRCWYNLPQFLSFAAVELPPGKHALHVEFLDSNGKMLAVGSRHGEVEVKDGGRDTVLCLSEKTN